MPEKPTTTPKSWRDVIEVHRAADLFPMNSDDEIREMGENIKANGLTSLIVFRPDRQLIDGRNRLEACEWAGLKIILAAMQPIDIVRLPSSGQISIVTDIDPYTYAVSANLHRRHLTLKQKRALVATVLKANPTKSNVQTAKLAKVDDNSAAVGTLVRAGIVSEHRELASNGHMKTTYSVAPSRPHSE